MTGTAGAVGEPEPGPTAGPAGVRPGPTGRRNVMGTTRPLLLAIGLVALVVGLAILASRMMPIGPDRAIRLATAHLVESDPTFRPADYRAEASRRDANQGVKDCWEVGFFSKATGRRYRGFYHFVYVADGMCVLSHSPRVLPDGSPIPLRHDY